MLASTEELYAQSSVYLSEEGALDNVWHRPFFTLDFDDFFAWDDNQAN
jgi:hypothetical protein